jgi:hypothetical protein
MGMSNRRGEACTGFYCLRCWYVCPRTLRPPTGRLYYVNASRNYNPEPKLNTITAPVLWINSADDFINPPELGIAQPILKRPSGKITWLRSSRRRRRSDSSPQFRLNA